MKIYIYIQADTNDADFISEKSVITEEEIALIMPVIVAIKNFKPYDNQENNFPQGECCREDLGELSAEDYYVGKGIVTLKQFQKFENFCPSDEYGIHTIESVEIIYVKKENKLI